MIRKRSELSIALMILAGLAAPLAAQNFRGTVSGRVVDPSDALIAGATVTLLNTGTNIATTQKTNDAGLYRFSDVDLGTYSLTVESPGFSRFIQQNILVQAQADITVNATLKTGDVREAITVEESPVAVEFNNTDLKETVETVLVDDSARLDRNPFLFALLDPAAFDTHRNEMAPFQSLSTNAIDVGGGTGGKNDILVDGNPVTIGQKTSYIPNPDAIAEVNVTQNSTDAETGHSFGGVQSIALKSGTNQVHGTAFYIGRNPDLNARADRTNPNTLSSRYNIWGGTVGHAVIKNKLFNFASYEQWLWMQPQAVTQTVPTALEATGNFSQSLNSSGGLRTIYNPYTTTLNPTTGAVSRQPYVNNTIPMSQMDPLALQLLPGIMKPNVAPSNITGANNFKDTGYFNWDYWNILDRVDYYVNDRLRVYGRVSRFHTTQGQINPLWQSYAGFDPHGSIRVTFAATGNAIYTLSDRTVIEGRVEYHTMRDDYGYPKYQQTDTSWSQWWPNNNWWVPIMPHDAQPIFWPGILVPSGNTFYSNLTDYLSHINGSSWGGKISHQIGDHFLKFGVDFRRTGGNSVTYTATSFNFPAALTANTFLSPTAATGDPWATFLIGALDNTSTAAYAPLTYNGSNLYSAFVQDDWKLSKRITLNLGVRYEFETPYADPAHEQSRYLNLAAPNTAIQAAPPVMPAQYAQYVGSAPIYNGQWVFSSPSHPGLWNSQPFVFQPRIGIAYKVNDKTAVRVGYAEYVSTTDYPPTYPSLPGTTSGYSGVSSISLLSPFTPFYSISQNPLAPLQGVPQATLTNPFPANNPIVPALQQSCGVYCGVGNTTVLSINQNFKRPVNNRLNVTFSRQLPDKVLFELTYFGNWGHDLPYVQPLNLENPQIGFTYKALTAASVPNPFYNYETAATFPGPLRNQATVTLASLLVPYPQYGAIYQVMSSGRHERYDSGEIKIQRPFANGYNLLFGYDYNYEREQQEYNALATYNRQWTWIPDTLPRSRINIAMVYQFPIGRDRRFLNHMNKVADAFLGGWQATGTWFFTTGDYLRFSAANVTCDPHLANPTASEWFNTSCISVLPAYTNNTNPWQFGDVRGPVYWDLQANVQKTFKVTERLSADLRLAAYNLTNRLNLADPDVVITDTTFGQVTAQSGNTQGRQLEYSLRMHF